MKGIFNKGFVKYTLALIIIALCIIFIAFYGPATGKSELHDTGLMTGKLGITKETPSLDVTGFYEVEDEPQEPPKPPPEPLETTDSGPKTGGSGGGFSGGGSSGGGGSIQYIPPPVVEHTECDGGVCILVSGSGEDECETDDDCIEECVPPHLEVDKTAEPSEVLCEEVSINLTVMGKGDPCGLHYPIDVVLIFDNSGSMDDDGWDDNISDWQPIGDAKIAGKAFVDLLGGNDKVGLVSFNTFADLEEGLTFDKNAVKNSIKGMSAGGWTNISQAIDYANQELVGNGRVDIPWFEILLSDGNNNCGMNNPPPDCHQRVFDRAQEAASNDIVIHTIALGENANQSLMQKVANLTGGKFYYVPDSEDLQEIYEEIAEGIAIEIAGKNVVAVDYLPDYVEPNESTLPPECEYNGSERKITCELGTVNINESFEILFNVYLYQLGYNLTNVYPDSGVSYTDYESSSQFLPFPETYVTVYGHEGADEICDDGYDNDCDGYTDWEDPDCRHNICNYVEFTCENVPDYNATGDECETYDDCPQHTECDYQAEQCVIVGGEDADECSTYDDCFHDICDYSTFTCEEMPVSEPGDSCSDDSDCFEKVCDYGQDVCKKVEPGTPGVACETYDDCVHTECCDMSCVVDDSPGTDECTNDEDCYYYACEGMSCVAVPGFETDECIDDDDCTDYVCNYDTLTCDAVVGSGNVECVTFEDCPHHMECDYVQEACVVVEGSGTDECSTYDDCFHDICDYQYLTCESRPISELGDSCETNEDCYHMDCEGMSCVPVAGEDADYCSQDSDCYYMYCDYGQEACLPTAGFEPDGCLNWNDCVHDICDYSTFTCEEMPVSEPGDSCSDDSDCFEKVCDYGQDVCKKVEPGTPGVACETWEDCIICGDGEVTPPEECELPGTDDNLYCSQSTTECSGHELGTRDAYGYCDLECGCIDDPFEYSCVEGECGAECEEDSDCPCPDDGCVGPDWYEYPDYGVCMEDCMCDVNEEPCDGPCKPTVITDDPRCTHFECDYVQEACILVEGEYVDECVTYEDCVHTECCGMSCIVTQSSGIDGCVTDLDCTDYVCNYVDLTCDAVAGSGYVECETFEDCPQHKVCDYGQQACIIVKGSGTDECSTYDDCFHDICDYGSLTCEEAPVSEPGDSCVTDSDCYHLDCEGMACIPFAGKDIDYCSQDSDCYYMYCDYGQQACLPTPGFEPDECSVWEDCLICGDGEVTPPEECELPGTDDNLYCSQSTTECSGHELGTRDAYGYCDLECGCIDDPFEYSCVEGECGAECDSSNDCPDYCEGDTKHVGSECSNCICTSGSTYDCNSLDGWYDIDRRWVSIGDAVPYEIDPLECLAKEQKKQEYRDCYCSESPSVDCYCQVTQTTDWFDTGVTAVADYEYSDFDLHVAGENCNAEIPHESSMPIDVPVGKRYYVIGEVARDQWGFQCQENENFELIVNGETGPESVDDGDPCATTFRMEDLGEFNFNSGMNDVIMHHTRSCPPDQSSNSVHIHKLCLFHGGTDPPPSPETEEYWIWDAKSCSSETRCEDICNDANDDYCVRGSVDCGGDLYNLQGGCFTSKTGDEECSDRGAGDCLSVHCRCGNYV